MKNSYLAYEKIKLKLYIILNTLFTQWGQHPIVGMCFFGNHGEAGKSRMEN